MRKTRCRLTGGPASGAIPPPPPRLYDHHPSVGFSTFRGWPDLLPKQLISPFIQDLAAYPHLFRIHRGRHAAGTQLNDRLSLQLRRRRGRSCLAASTLTPTGAHFVDPGPKYVWARISELPDRPGQALTVVKIVIDGFSLLLTGISQCLLAFSRQIPGFRIGPISTTQVFSQWIPELTDHGGRAFPVFNIELNGPDAFFV